MILVFSSALTNKQIYLENLDQREVYQKITNELLVKNIEIGGNSPLSKDFLDLVASRAAEILQKMLRSNIDNISLWIDTSEPELMIYVPVNDIKKLVTNEDVQKIVKEYLTAYTNSLRSCTEQELARGTFVDKSGNIVCKVPDFDKYLGQNMDQISKQLEAEFDVEFQSAITIRLGIDKLSEQTKASEIAKLYPEFNTIYAGLTTVKQAVFTARLIGLALLGFGIVSILILWLTARKWFRDLSIVAIFSGLILGITGIGASLYMQFATRADLLSNQNEITKQIIIVVTKLLEQIVYTATNMITIIGTGMFIGGSVIIIVRSILLSVRRKG